MSDGLTRRALIEGTLAAGGILAFLRDPEAAWSAAEARARRGRVPFARGGSFPHGVASGHPNRRAISLWTRVGELDRTARLELEIASDPGFGRVVHRQEVRASAVRDFTAHARVRSPRLKPGEQYFYRFSTRTTGSPVGRFRTSLPPDSQEPVRIGFFSCQDWEAGYYTAHAGLAQEEDLDLVVCLGDYIYERHYYNGPADRKDTLGANKDGEVQTLDEYRAKYRQYRTDANLQAMHAAHPMVAIWDDHEVEDNYAGDRPGEATGQVRVPFLERRRNGYLAFMENIPAAPIRADRFRIYRRLRLGAMVDLFLLDQRQYRDDQPCGDQLFVPCPAGDDPGRTMLGTRQKEWLKAGLASSGAAWKVIGNQVMAMALDLPNGNAVNPDQWDGYAAERREILEAAVAKGVKDMTFITGDIHTFFAGDVTTTGRRGGTPAATEFVGGSITSLGIPESFGNSQNADQIATLTENVQLFNPHIKFNDQQNRGYGVLEARPEELLVELKAPTTTLQRQAPMTTLQRFRVRRGVPRVELL